MPAALLCLGASENGTKHIGLCCSTGMLPDLLHLSCNYVVYRVIICFNPITPLTITQNFYIAIL